jgi:hypothetical protein
MRPFPAAGRGSWNATLAYAVRHPMTAVGLVRARRQRTPTPSKRSTERQASRCANPIDELSRNVATVSMKKAVLRRTVRIPTPGTSFVVSDRALIR